MKEKTKDLIMPAVTTLIKTAPDIIESVSKKKEENFFDKNRSWIFAIILTIFVTQLGYINMFSNDILNSIINILFGLIVLILTSLFLTEEKNIFKTDSNFFKFLIVVLITLGIINSFYHIGYATFNLFLVLIK